MASYAGLDVSQQATQICILEATGAVRWTGKARTEPAALAAAPPPTSAPSPPASAPSAACGRGICA